MVYGAQVYELYRDNASPLARLVRLAALKQADCNFSPPTPRVAPFYLYLLLSARRDRFIHHSYGEKVARASRTCGSHRSLPPSATLLLFFNCCRKMLTSREKSTRDFYGWEKSAVALSLAQLPAGSRGANYKGLMRARFGVSSTLGQSHVALFILARIIKPPLAYLRTVFWSSTLNRFFPRIFKWEIHSGATILLFVDSVRGKRAVRILSQACIRRGCLAFYFAKCFCALKIIDLKLAGTLYGM